jgi:hypothetical protein
MPADSRKPRKRVPQRFEPRHLYLGEGGEVGRKAGVHGDYGSAEGRRSGIILIQEPLNSPTDFLNLGTRRPRYIFTLLATEHPGDLAPAEPVNPTREALKLAAHFHCKAGSIADSRQPGVQAVELAIKQRARSGASGIWRGAGVRRGGFSGGDGADEDGITGGRSIRRRGGGVA